jgi:iron complex outermembrane receptor protein
MNTKIVVVNAMSLMLSISFAEAAYAEDAVAVPETEAVAGTPESTGNKKSAGKNAKPLVNDEDDLLLREMVVSADKDKPVQQRTELGKLTVYTPVSGSVVDKAELEQLQLVNNLLELGKRVPGISMLRNMRIPDGGKQYTESRIDGLRSTSLNTSVFDTVDMSGIERIDVITGPASALYGSGALGGTISLTSRQPPEEPGGRLSQEAGSWGYRRTQGNVGTSTADGRFGFIVTGSKMDNGGWRRNAAPANQDSAAEHKNGEGLKAFLRPTETTRISVGYDQLYYNYRWAGTLRMAKFNQDWRQSEAGTYGQSIDTFVTRSVHLQQMVGERGEINIISGQIDDSSTNYGVAGSGGANNVICDDPGSLSAALAGTVKCRAVNNNSPAVTNTLKAGTNMARTTTAVYRHEFDLAKSSLYVGSDNYEIRTDTATYSNVYNALQAQSGQWAQGAMTSTGQGAVTVRKENTPFVHYEFSPLEKIRIHLGERFGRVTDVVDDRTAANRDVQMTKKGNVLRSGVTYEFTQDHLVWGNLGQTFNPPATSTLLDTSVKGVPGNTIGTVLEPERALTSEIGFRGRFDDIGLQYDVALYHTANKGFNATRICTLDEQIALNAGATCNVNENAGQLSAKGLESMFSWAASRWLDIGATYTNARAYYDNYISSSISSAGVITKTNYSGNSYQAMPRHRMNLRIAVKPAIGWQVELECDHISSYFVDPANSGTYSRPDLFNLRASYRSKDWSFWAHTLNLTNRQYATRVGYSTIAGVNQLAASAGQGNSGSYTPRTFRAGVSYNF